MAKTEAQGWQNIINDLIMQRETWKKKAEFYEARLQQRYEKTIHDYQKILPYLEHMRQKVLKIFMDLPPAVGWTHEEIQERFKEEYPMLCITNVPRRVRELVEQNKLWSQKDEKGDVRFYLKLKDDKTSGKGSKSHEEK
jgi:hypothetical protein